MKLPSLIKEVWANFLKKPATIKYPFERLPIPLTYRGKHELIKERCTGCGLCAKTCPAFAISMTIVDDNILPKIDLGRCIFCFQCEDLCPRGAIRRGGKYELASWSKSDLIVS